MGYADLMMMELPEDSELYDSASEIYEASAKAKRDYPADFLPEPKEHGDGL